jgi:uncharacterized protein (DUF1778 family)
MKRTTNRRSQQGITARIPRQACARIEEAAAWRGVSVSSFVAEAAAKEAEQVIEKERQVQLSRQDAELLVSLLDNPPDPNSAMGKAVKAYQRLIRG